MVELTFTIFREHIVGSTAGKTWLRTPACLVLVPEKGRPLIASVGEDEAGVLRRVRQPLADTNLPTPRVAHPREDAWWDLAWRWPRPTIEEERSLPAPADNSSVLLISPLCRATWAPHLTAAVLYYHLRQRSRGRLLKPKVVLRAGEDFDEIEWAEISDALTGFYVVCDPPVSPCPVTRAAKMRRMSSIGTLLSLPIFLVLGFGVIRCTRDGVFSQGASSLILMGLVGLYVCVLELHSRAEARADREAPRRQQEAT